MTTNDQLVDTHLVRDPETGASFRAPSEWGVQHLPDVGWVALEPQHDEDAFRANLVLSVVDNGGRDFKAWQQFTDEGLPHMLEDYLLLDLEKLDVAGQPGGRRLAHHLSPQGQSLVMEQWFTDRDGLGFTLTATVDAMRYATFAPIFDHCAAQLVVGGGR